MKRHWILLAAAMLVGCRTAQPSPNPFLRTTVPPPGTGVVVSPGEQYAPGVSPQFVTPPGTPNAAPPPVTTQPVPVTPAPTAPAPLIAPPPVKPQGEKFHPPGGSYLFHQSSNEQPRSGDAAAASRVVLASAQEGAGGGSSVTFATPDPTGMPGTVQPAAYAENPMVQAAAATPNGVTLQVASVDNRGDPPERAAAVRVDAPAQGNTIRIVGPSAPTAMPAVAAAAPFSGQPADRPVLRMTVGEPQRTISPSLRDPAGDPSVSQVAIVAPGGGRPTTASFVTPGPDSRPVVQAAYQPADGYAYSPDYGSLRGRLEYSQSLRQWKLRYIPIDGQTDGFGGSVVLADTPALQSFQPGEMVAVRGALAGSPAQSSGFSPLYEPGSIELVSH